MARRTIFSRVGTSLQSPLVPPLRLDATDPLPKIVERLNTFQPQALVAYASMARLLAEEQMAGRLRIAPQAVLSASEVLLEETRQRIVQAWKQQPFNVYAATESAGVASECAHHAGMHLSEDLVITEVVDEEHRPVPPGTFGAKVLVTVLFSRTQPLIRYGMSVSCSLEPRQASILTVWWQSYRVHWRARASRPSACRLIACRRFRVRESASYH